MRKSALRGSVAVIVMLSIANLRGQNTTTIKEAQDFEIQGVALFECPCPAHGCPCQKNGRPTHGTCFGSDFAHIKTGHYGDVKLDGLNMGFVGDVVDANSDRMFATLYLDQKATPAQSEALTHIFEYLNGAYIALEGQAALPLKRVKVVPINFRESRDQTDYELQIPAILKEKVLLKRDKMGQPLFTMPATDVWSNIVHNAENIRYEYHDSEVGKSWDYSGHYANVKYFRLTKKMYAEQKMLSQQGDMSGSWTPKQLEIIRQAGLKEK